MKSNKFPLYILFALIAVAIVYRVGHPPAPIIPGPLGEFPAWKSVAQLGDMVSQGVNPSGTMWAGAWNEQRNEKGRSAIRILDFNGYKAVSSALADDNAVEQINWADDNTIRVLCENSKNSGSSIVYLDAKTGKNKRTASLATRVEHVLSWPNGLDKLAVVLEEKKDSATLAAISESGSIIGKTIAVNLPKDASVEPGGGIATDGSVFVFSISDPAAKDGRSFYWADTKTGVAKKAFDLGDVPGRIEGIWPTTSGALIVCNIKDKLEDVVFDNTTGKLSEQPNGVGDLSKWPGAPKSIAFTTYDGGLEFDLATGKSKGIFDMTKKTSVTDKEWRDLLRDSRCYPLKNGNFVTVSETGGAIDIREIKPDGSVVRAFISRI